MIFASLELTHPYYFLQDDNRVQNLPYYIYNFKSIISGEIPLYNFHQYLGTPHLACIQPGVLYPVNYVGLLLSKLFLGHYYGGMDFIALIHLLGASIGFYQLVKSFGLGKESCFFGAVAWAFCPIVLTGGSHWVHFLIYAAIFPWTLRYSIRQIYAVSAHDFLVLAILRVLAFFAGHPQLFVYMITFESLTVIALKIIEENSHKYDIRTRIKNIAKSSVYLGSNFIVVLLLSLPQLLPTLNQIKISASRNQIWEWDDYVMLSCKLTKYIQGLVAPNTFFIEHPNLSHIGYVTLISIILAIFYCLKREKYVPVFLLLGLISLFWACDILVTKILYHLPVYNRFRWPFKLTFFTSFYLIALSTFGFDFIVKRLQMLSRFGYSFTPIILILLLIHILNFALLYTIFPQTKYSLFSDSVPFSEPYSGKLAGSRFASFSQEPLVDTIYNRSDNGNQMPMIGYNFASIWGVYSLAGYEVMIAQKNLDASFGLYKSGQFRLQPGTILNLESVIPLDYLRQWGVSYYIVDKRLALDGIHSSMVVSPTESTYLIHDPLAKPLVYLDKKLNGDGLRYKFQTNSVKIATQSDTKDIVVVNMLFNSHFHASIDGSKTSVNETPQGQMSIDVPPGSHSIMITYRDMSFIWGAIISAITALIMLNWAYLEKKKMGIICAAN